MKKIVHYIGLDVYKESIAAVIAPERITEVRTPRWPAEHPLSGAVIIQF